MNYDEFAFFNQQLAAMLREGVPLEGALKELCSDMKSGALKEELQKLQSELSAGTPLDKALAQRKLPPLYTRMVAVGVRSNDLPGVLLLLADHYSRVSSLWTRLKGLTVYPLLVITVSLGLSLMLALVFSHFLKGFVESLGATFPIPLLTVWIAPIAFALVAVFIVVAVSSPSVRARLRWRLPAFREASLAQLASALTIMLRNGVPLPEALALAESLEIGTPAESRLAEWRRLVENGQGKPSQWPATPPFPPLFVWLIRTAGEDVASGFQKAAEIYQARAAYRTDLALYGALPVSILLLGQLVFWQAAPLFRGLIWLMNMLGDTGGTP